MIDTPTLARSPTAAVRPQWQRTVVVAAVAVIAYLALVSAALVSGHSAVDFAFVGSKPRSETALIRRYAPPGTTTRGYDGQYALFIALDPKGAYVAIDDPAYRYSHILYPMLSRAVALGSPRLIPAAMIAVNIAALFAVVLALARLLELQGRSPRLAWLFAVYPGMIYGVERDLNEPVAFACAAIGVLLLDWRSRRRLALACAFFAAAGLARETLLIFPLCFAASHAWRTRRLAAPALFFAGSAAPYLVVRLVLQIILPVVGPRPGIARYPFEGIVEAPHLRGVQLMTVVIPILLLTIAAALTIRADRAFLSSPFALLLVAEVVLTASLGPASFADYMSSSRLQLGVLFAALLLPQMRARRVGLAAAVLAFTPIVSLIATAAANPRPL